MSTVPGNILRANPHLLGYPGGIPLANADGVFDVYAPRHFCGIGGKGREGDGVYSMPDPNDDSQDPASRPDPSFELRHIPKILLQLDDDAIFEFLLLMVTREREAHSDAFASFLDLFDPDKCPDAYLPYLARAVGANIDRTRPIGFQRQQIAQAVPMYKTKGLISSFEHLFNSLGYEVIVHHLYLMPYAVHKRAQVEAAFITAGIDIALYLRDDILSWPLKAPLPFYPPGYDAKLLTPTNYIDIELVDLDLNEGAVYDIVQDDNPGTPSAPDPTYYDSERQLRESDITDIVSLLRDLQSRLEEVRPIHVVFRMFIVFFGITDVWPVTLLDTAITVVFDVHDDWLANSGLFSDTTLFNTNVDLRETNHIPAVLHNGHTVWNRQSYDETDGQGNVRHRIGHRVKYRSTTYPQQNIWRPYWGVSEPHRTTPEDTVRLAGQYNTLTTYIGGWTSGTNYADGDVVSHQVVVAGMDYTYVFFVNCERAHTASAANEPFVGADWQAQWSSINPPAYKPHSIDDYLFAPITADAQTFEGAIAAPWSSASSGGGIASLVQFDQSKWGFFKASGAQDGYHRYTKTGLFIASATEPLVYEFDLQPRSYGDTGNLTATGGNIVLFDFLAATPFGSLSYADVMTGVTSTVSFRWKQGTLGTVSALGTLKCDRKQRVKVVIRGTADVRVYVDDIRRGGTLSGALAPAATLTVTHGGISGGAATHGYIDNVMLGSGIGPVVEDIIQTRTNTGTTTTTTTTSTTSTTTTTTTNTTTTTTSTTTTSTSTSSTTSETSETTTTSTTTTTTTSTTTTNSTSNTTSNSGTIFVGGIGGGIGGVF